MTEIKTVTLDNGITLAYKEYGTGDKYLLSTQNFFFEDCHMALLGQEPYDYHVFLIYMRGYNKSTHIFDTEPHDYVTVWGEDVVDFAKHMGIETFYYSGISHGNWAGWHICKNHPHLLRGFVCCDGIVQYRPKYDGPAGGPRRSQPDLDALVGNREALSKMAWMEPWPTQNPERLARRAANKLEHTEILMGRTKEEFTVRNNNMMIWEADSEEEFYQKLSTINVPVMLWNGGLDPAAKVENVLKVTQAIPGARMLVYQHLGHGGADECPELTARDCDRYFKDIEGYIL